MKPLKTGDPCPCCGMPIKSTNPEMLRLLTDIRDLGSACATLKEWRLF